ncbi:MAG: YhfC family glutamic-type intramembrane protease [Anaerolineae bacterium]|jgi:uncharacterized membrane protein YhfC
MLYLTFGIEILLMIGLPVGIWFWSRRRFNVPWALVGAGITTFILSQAVHLPLNGALGLLGGERGVALWPIPAMAAVAGISAGLCEELARYLALRFWRREARSWGEGIAFGAGHGGVESITLGVVVLINVIYLTVIRRMGGEALGLTGETLAQFETDVAAFWSTAWYLPLLGGLERVFALTMHIAWTLLVVRSLRQRNLIWLVAAILFHAVVDAVTVGTVQAGASALAIEGTMLLFALAAGGLIWLLRSRLPELRSELPGSGASPEPVEPNP